MFIRVHVIAGAKKERVLKESDTEYEIHVKEKPERNQANDRVREILGAILDTDPKHVRMLTGHHSSSKMFSIER